MKKGYFLLLFFLCTFTAFSQELPEEITQAYDTIVVDSLEIAEAEEDMLYKEDTLDYIFYSLPTELEYVPGDDDPAVLRDRLSCVEKEIPLIYNDKVHAFINYFTVKDREYTRLMMRRKNLYFPLFEEYLAKYNLPDLLMAFLTFPGPVL